MKNLINSWAQGLIVTVIISVIIEMILPKGNNKKYIKVILGIYILFSIIYPFINYTSNNKINLNNIFNDLNLEIDNKSVSASNIDTNKYIENEYKGNLEKSISKDLEEKGYYVTGLNLFIETENQDRYGMINSIVLDIEKKEKKDEKKKAENCIVNEVKIAVLNEKKKENIDNDNKETITKDEIDSIKKYFEGTYSIDFTRIHINE